VPSEAAAQDSAAASVPEVEQPLIIVDFSDEICPRPSTETLFFTQWLLMRLGMSIYEAGSHAVNAYNNC
jgi:hypothetical protein